MNNELEKELDASRKTGAEKFFSNGKELPFDLLSFWQWYASDTVGNALRGVLAEYIVAMAVGCTDELRKEWDDYDMKTLDGIKIEVKSAAYIQSWAQKKLSPIRFGIQPTQGWDSVTGEYDENSKRRSDVYVFCVLAHKDKPTINPLDLEHWKFYVMATKLLDKLVPEQKAIGLPSLLKLNPKEATYNELHTTIKQALHEDN